ncbi:Fur family ferric uptake transcriptional regulator [Sedimentibacter acidaminivorans]|jgi:Fur family transcriptional regulator, ferric uptake regulator|uniref:Fur family ferric uptake transcriptional regulator n=1 Tax=Sedimentibacter acidaminivorans TaxID=913099 RepID=A0ABS4GBS9_9FIRM|nr:Fur family transcriptional regulator [Sedimentibacter acidaminivorans]MBP1924987.1 Fur family ferric uptake transcriptional regulator [Sedimentibacter acidaminivorans]
MGCVEFLKEKLGERNFKLTNQRKVVFEILTEKKEEHLSPEEIYEHIKDIYPEIGLATIYRTLQLFEEIGLVYKLNFDDGCYRYEILSPNNKEVHQHHHLICKKCGKIIEVKEDLMNSLEEIIEKQYNFEIKNHIVKFTGICSQCRNKENNNGNRKET